MKACDSREDAARTDFILAFSKERGVTVAAVMGENSA